MHGDCRTQNMRLQDATNNACRTQYTTTAEHNAWCPQKTVNYTAEHMHDCRTQNMRLQDATNNACRTQYTATAEHNAWCPQNTINDTAEHDAQCLQNTMRDSRTRLAAVSLGIQTKNCPQTSSQFWQ